MHTFICAWMAGWERERHGKGNEEERKRERSAFLYDSYAWMEEGGTK